jgi:beta-glucosidase
MGEPWGTAATIDYSEGAEVGYRWFAQQREQPLYAFGHGLSYTRFGYSDFQVLGGDTITATFTVTNTGDRQGADVPQVYLTGAPGGARMRLLGFERVDLKPGESKQVTVTADPRVLARFDDQARQWRITEGAYQVALGCAADSLGLAAETVLHGALFGS